MTQPPPAGWYADPHVPTQKRFWNGAAWTDQVQPSAPPMPPPPAPFSQPTITPPIYQPAPEKAWPARHPVLTGLGVLVVIAIIGAAIGGSGSDGNNDASSSAPPIPATPVTVLDKTGNGDTQTQEFTVSDEWSIQYSFDCATFGQAGNFVVDVQGTDGVSSLTNRGPNALATSGADTVFNHHGGTYYLSVLSECDWHLKVVSGG